MAEIYHALGLHMHQPPDNLKLLIDDNEWEAQQIIHSYERAARYAHKFRGKGCLNVGFSGVLLEQFQDPYIVDEYRKFVDIPEMLSLYRTAGNIEIIGMGYYHPIFPLIPTEDWKAHLMKGREIAEEIFGKAPKGFWPSEMAFSMEMIPALKAAGYDYVVVDHVHVTPEKETERPDFFKPYLAEFEGVAITVVPRNRDISNAQESGMDPKWFNNEVAHKIKESPSDNQNRLVTTWSDGENGGWFRQMDDNSGFFGHFFAPFIETIQSGETTIKSIKISDFLEKHPASEKASVKTGAWNVASTSGYDFSQWAGSGSQKKAIEDLFSVSKRYWELKKTENSLTDERKKKLKQARKILLEAETSCYLFWGDAWIPKLYEKLEEVNSLL
jgi:4-alpha-glucanotransferase